MEKQATRDSLKGFAEAAKFVASNTEERVQRRFDAIDSSINPDDASNYLTGYMLGLISGMVGLISGRGR